MKNIEEIIKSIEDGTVKLELINDMGIANPSTTIVDANEYKKVYVIPDDNAFKAIYVKGEEYYYGERIYCADEAQTGSCNIEYEKLYKIL
ncbi:hypothetical protein GOM49_12990 [Clostridium bovifaecis]|uniref:Uncharacterized protein n=1 Tax=Clostridium bovifaecis TaxID=2184719 RepID=A0A6I6FDF0_9CLOT|nr:hypothetical protein GOM49_12990 [Clostridium bovifaecis]